MKPFLFSIALLICFQSNQLQGYHPSYSGDKGDLQFEEVTVIKRKKNFVCVRYTIKNTGTASINLLGKTDKKNDNLTVRVYLSGDKEFRKGDKLLDGTYIENKLLPGGKLMPGKSISGELKVDLRLKTNFQNVLIFKLDDFKTIPEADEWNNLFPLVI